MNLRSHKFISTPIPILTHHHPIHVEPTPSSYQPIKALKIPHAVDPVLCAGRRRWVLVPPPRAGGAALVALGLVVPVEVHLEGGNVVLEAEGGHGPEEVVAVDGLALLTLALVRGLPGDEADELRDTLLDGLLGLLGDLGVRREGPLHDPAHVGDRQESVLLLRVVVGAVGYVARQGAPNRACLASLPGHWVCVYACLRERERERFCKGRRGGDRGA
ncbi:hypothetical protein EUGRSUZ_I00332 [Eucalyptus grandis]|uniref:Uncharacterized protein n=2 Tax=Eucalyptus grandis TaxID=71139 RepID=A0ACC3JC71_EUCGR|nr:hypothetical protein EUGRSUZ_I00332 [Eucalyptus grandis]